MQRWRHDQAWRPVRLPVYPDWPDVRQDLLPVWSFTAVYGKPDGEILPPAAYDGAGGALEMFATGYGKCPATPQLLAERRRRFFYFDGRHVDPRFHVEHRRSDRDTPRPPSQSYGDSRKDWDHVMAFRDRVLRENGLTARSRPWDMAYAFAREMYRNWRGGGSIRHPADVLTHKAYCLGAANATVAILESLDIPARGVAVSEHALCEAYLDGAWRAIDSSNHYINHPPGSDCLLPTDYMELTATPDSPAHGNRISDFHRAVFYHFADGSYGIPDGRWLREPILWMCPAHARAIYPERERYRFKTLDPNRLRIVERAYNFLHVPSLAHDLSPGETLRESVWLGDLDGVRSFELELRFAPFDGRHPDGDSTRGLEVVVGGEAFDISKTAAWPLRPHWDSTMLLTVPLPRAAFRENAVNWIHVRNGRKTGVFRIPMTPAIVEPYVMPLLPA